MKSAKKNFFHNLFPLNMRFELDLNFLCDYVVHRHNNCSIDNRNVNERIECLAKDCV